jgi:triphosphoribosyl-dephospho-CoA synthase
MLPVGLCVQLACIWEATARKPGNVHRHRDFNDTSYLDFLVSAAAISPIMETAWSRPVGETILAAVQATRQMVRVNTNLGIILLLAPLAAVVSEPLRQGLPRVLNQLSVQDAQLAYVAIRLANPGGLGHSPEQDVHREPTQTLREVMTLAADRDFIALQYANGFRQVLDEAVPELVRPIGEGLGIEEAIIRCQLLLLSRYPDSLIARKRGLAEALAVRNQARRVIQGGLDREGFDAWLRDEGHARNPGTTADLIVSALFVSLREELISPQQPYLAFKEP